MFHVLKNLLFIKEHKKISISRVLTVSLILTVVTVSLVTFSLTYLIIFETSKTRLEKKADELIFSLAAVLEIPLRDLDEQSIQMTGEAYTHNEFVERLQIADEMGNVYFQYARESHAATVSRSSQILHKGQSIGLVEISLTAKPYSESNMRSFLSGIASLVVIVLVLVLVTKYFSDILLNQLNEKLGRVVNAYSSGKQEPASYDMPFLEFLPLVNVLDDMKTRIDSQIMELRHAEKKYRSIFENAIEGIFQSTPKGQYLSVNPAMARIFGYDSTEEFIETIQDIEHQLYVDPRQYAEFIQRLQNGESIAGFEVQLYRKDRKIVWASLHVRPVFDEDGTLTFVEGIIRDVTERRQIEEKIGNALKEKEVLLRELYHRTKNNMLVIISMLSLQSNYTDDERVLNIFRETCNRIHAMALVHKKLYQSENLSEISLKEYIMELTELIVNSFNITPDNEISVMYNLDDVCVLIDSAIPCGLIINELVSNSLKHAFPDNLRGEIVISLRKAEQRDIEIKFSDNGIGVPEDFNFRNTATLGLKMVSSIVEHQLRGHVEFIRNSGLTCQIRFGDTLYEKRV